MRTLPKNILCLVSLLAAGGCTLLAGAELSDKPAETAAAGGQGGSGTSSSAAQTGSGTSSSSGKTGSSTSSGSGQPSGSSGAAPCPPNTANCDGIAAQGCDVNLQTDPDHCGSCATVCIGIMSHCAGGKCK